MSDFVIENGILKRYTGSDEHVVIPEGVTRISYEAFLNCSSLKSIVIPEGVIRIGYAAFCDCSSLTSIVIPEGVTSISKYAFHGCRSLTSIVIPDSVTTIGPSAFHGCRSLTSIVIPNSVTTIGPSAFHGCCSLTSIIIPEGVTSIGYWTFRDCHSLKSIVIPKGVSSIGYEAFLECRSLTNIIIPEGVTSIGYGAFRECCSLTNIIIPEGVTSVSKSAFYGCRRLTGIIIPEGVTSIGYEAFRNCSSLTSIVIPEGVTDISESVFAECDNLKVIQTGTKLTATAVGKDFKARPIVINDPAMLPMSLKPYAAIGYAEKPHAPDTPRAKAHFKYIKSNAAKLMKEAFEHPALLHLMLENKLLKPEVAQAYVDEAIRRKLPEATAALLDYQQNKLSAAEKKKSADKAAAREETVTNFVFDTENLTVLQGKVFVVTGKLKTFTSRDELKACLDACQAILTENLDKDTDYLLTNTPNSGTAKNKKAESLGVKKITEDEFNQMIGRHPQ